MDLSAEYGGAVQLLFLPKNLGRGGGRGGASTPGSQAKHSEASNRYHVSIIIIFVDITSIIIIIVIIN